MATSLDDEAYRLHNLVHGETPSQLYAELRFQCDRPGDARAKVVSVMDLVLEGQRKGWPDDDRWRGMLPEWLMSTLREYTDEEVAQALKDRSHWATLPWDFSSWVDRMRQRDWQWWSSRCEDRAGELTVYVLVAGHPYAIGALEHLFEAAGCRRIQHRD